jgi:Tol biopolymer transport system component/C-terminal processing protease CtpA/Prc
MKTATIILLCLSLQSYSQNLLRFPAISPDGNLIALSFQGDIWTVTADGGTATRLTIHEGYESNPVFSPDGKSIAFSGARYGNNDIFKIAAAGGPVTRLTYRSSGDNITSWTQSDKIVFNTNRDFNQIERQGEIYSINPQGGTESRLMDVVGFDATISPNGRFIAFVRGDINPVARKDYKGSSDRNIWIYDIQNKTYKAINGFETNDILPQWVGNNTIYFLSSNDGQYNLYRTSIDAKGSSGKPEKLTSFKDESIRHFSISVNGRVVVLEKDVNLYAFNPETKTIKKIAISINADDRLDPIETKTMTTGANEYAVSPNGKLIAYSLRGEVFVKEADKEKSRSVNISNHPYRDYLPAWLNDSMVIFCSDRKNGNFDFYLSRSSDSMEHNIFKSLKHELIQLTNTPEDENIATVSGDGKKLAYVRGRGGLVVNEIDSSLKLKNEKVLNNSWAPATAVAWSPDNKWLAYSQTDLYFNQEVFIQAADNSSTAKNISMHPRTDANPYWSTDGSKLGFTSERSYSTGTDIYFVWLKKEDWEKQSQDWREADPPVADADKSKDKKSVKPITIDFDKIYDRVVQVTNIPGNESLAGISKDGETFYYTATNSDAKGRDLYSVKWDGRELKELTKGGTNPVNVSIDKEGKYLYYLRAGAMNRMDIKANTTDALPFTAKLKIDYPQERTQVFEEAWRTIRDGYYDPKMHGYDWNKLHDQYLERCVIASTSNDFRDMFNYLLGELNSSHMGLTAADRIETNKDATGLIGVELMPISTGMKIVRVIPGTPADKTASKLHAGETIIKVNESAYDPRTNFYSLLNETINEKIILSVLDSTGKSHEVVLRPAATIGDALYEEWVDNRKRLVDQYSHGRLGYIHIRSMDFASFETVEREFTAAGYGKDGLLIDVRYNGGGSTTDYLMTILNYKQHAYTIPRGASNDIEKDKLRFRDYYPIGERLVYAAWTKPSIALCNEGSYSNAEIFSHAYKTLGVGKLVGVPTNGSVISTGGRGLMDGSFVRLPLRGWFTKATNKEQELGPCVPDIIVENAPDWIAKNTDDQLKAAVNELLKEIENKK